MDQALQVQLTAMRNDIQASAIPDDCKQTALWCLGQLPPLYSNFRLTNESCYGEKIVSLVRAVLSELAKEKVAQGETQKRSMGVAERFQQFHEEFGLPSLPLKLPTMSSRRLPKLGASR